MNSRKFLILGLSLIAMVVVSLLDYEFEAVNSTELRVGRWERYVGSSGGSVVFRADFWVASWTLLGFTVQDPVFSLTADNIVLYESSLMRYGPTGYGLNFWTNDSSIVRVLNSVNANVVVLTMRAAVGAGLYVRQTTLSVSQSLSVCPDPGCASFMFSDYLGWPPCCPITVLALAGGEAALLILGGLFLPRHRRTKRETRIGFFEVAAT